MITGFAKPLIAIPSPRDLPEFAAAVDKLPADKLFVKYMREQQAYDVIRQYFLTHREYDYLAILPDDLIVTPYHWHQLMSDLHEFNFEVLCGLCNLDISQEHKGMLNVCVRHLPSRSALTRSYDWLIEGGPEHQAYLDCMDPPIIQVAFAGFPFMFIRRDVVAQIEFKDDLIWNPHKVSGCCVDVIFTADCHDLGIPIYCDLRCRMNHLKVDDNIVIGKMTGIKQPEVKFVPFASLLEESEFSHQKKKKNQNG